MVRYYVQDGNMIQSPTSTILGPDDTDTITDAFCQAKKTLFGDVNDYAEKGGSAATDPGVQRGDCQGGEESTPTYLRQNYPDGWVSFQNAFVGPIGSFLSQPPTPSPGTGGGCCQFEADCGDCGEDGSGWCHQSVSNCAVCTGFFNYSATAPNCGGSPSPQPQPTPSPGPCSDENQNCGIWAASGQCEANPAYMLVNCALSCGVCSPPTQAPAPPTQAPAPP